MNKILLIGIALIIGGMFVKGCSDVRSMNERNVVNESVNKTIDELYELSNLATEICEKYYESNPDLVAIY